MGALRPWHIIVLVVVLILLFGASRLPKATSALVKSLRIIKAETKTLHDDEQNPQAANQQPAPGTYQQQPGPYQQQPPAGNAYQQQPGPYQQQQPGPYQQQPPANGYQAPPVVDPAERTRDH